MEMEDKQQKDDMNVDNLQQQREGKHDINNSSNDNVIKHISACCPGRRKTSKSIELLLQILYDIYY